MHIPINMNPTKQNTWPETRNTTMKLIAIITILMHFAMPTLAQHCEWDNYALIGVRPMYNGQPVEGVQIELISTDNPYSTREETAQNGLYTIYKDNTKPFAKRNDIKRIKDLDYFDFIRTDYAVITGSHFHEGLFIKITDISMGTGRQKFATQIIPVTAAHLLGLCGIRQGTKAFDSLYQPIVVTLTPATSYQYYHEFLSTNISSATFYTPPVWYNNDSVIFQVIQTGITTTAKGKTFNHEFFKIHRSRFALAHFDSLKNIHIDKQGWVQDIIPQQPTTNTPVANNNPATNNYALPPKITSKKVAESNDEIPDLKAFIAWKLSNGNAGMERYYLKNNIEQFYSMQLYEYLDTYDEIKSATLEFDLDHDNDMDYCVVYRHPKPHIEFYVYDNVLRQFVADSLMSKAPVLYLNLKENRLITADYPMPQMEKTNEISTYVRWNNNWQMIQWELQDYLKPHNSVNEAHIRRLNDTMCTYVPRIRQYIQHGDYNFDGKTDTRVAHDSNVVFRNTSFYCDKFDYFIYDRKTAKPVKDELLSAGTFTFDFNNKTAAGYVTKRNYTRTNVWTSVTDKYEWVNGKFLKTEKVEQIQACPNCEKTITIRSKLINGKWQQVSFDPGAE